MALIKTLKYITNHPLTKDKRWSAVKRFLSWQFRKKFNSDATVYPFVGSSQLLIQKGMTGATGNIYTGLHEFEDMGFLLHFLQEDDLFVDIGANVGTYTVLAAEVKKANTISIEPVPETFEHLLNNIKLNNIDNRVVAYNLGLGSKETTLKFTTALDTVNHVVVDENEMINGEIIEVNVITLDKLLKEKSPAIIKIDVEGFEREVLDGAVKTLSNEKLEAIIIELNNSGSRYGYSDESIHQQLTSYGFSPYRYNPFKRQLSQLDRYNASCNTIYIKNLKQTVRRVESAKKIKVLHNTF